jgi:hypothetical protein
VPFNSRTFQTKEIPQMTEIQYLSHAEQMDAERSHFNHFWQKFLLPRYRALSDRQRANLMHAAWKVWRDANNKCHINKHSCNLNKSSSGC